MRIQFTIVLSLLSLIAFSQTWKKHLPEKQPGKEYSFYDYQHAFNTYWEGKNVDNGYYFKNGVKEKAYGWKQFKRWEYFWKTRVEPVTGAFPTSRQYQLADIQYQQHASREIAGNWTNLGPSSSKGGYAGVGRINQIAFHPTDPNTFWITTPIGGLWVTYDGGNSWEVLTDGNDVLTTTAIAIPSDFETSQTIYLGTGDMDSWQHDNGIGVLKSTDAGATWQSTGLTFDIRDSYTVNKFLIHPENNHIIYAATTDGIFKTEDGGDNWFLVFNTNYINDMEFKPDDPSIIYACSKEWGRIYKMTENGLFGKEVYDKYDSGARRVELAVSAAAPDIVYAVVADEESGLYGILKSEDSGESFSRIFTPDPSPSKPNLLTWGWDGNGTGGQGWYDLTLAADPHNPDILYCGGVNTWKSTDGGSSWSINNFWTYNNDCDNCITVHADKHFHAFRGNDLFECNDGGLYKTTDGGSSWENISNGIINSQMYKLSVAQTSRYDMIAGLQDNGTKNYANGVWSDVLGGDGMECLIDYTDENIQYGETQNGGSLRRTMDHWDSRKNVKPEGASGDWVTPFIINPVNPKTLYSGYRKVYVTHDRGDNWDVLFEENSGSFYNNLAISPADTSILLAHQGNKIWKITDGGKKWTDIAKDLSVDAEITYVTIKDDNVNTIWVTFGGYNEHGVYQTTDGGKTWTNISTGLPEIPVNTVIQNKQNIYFTELYVGTDFGVYVKLGEANWQLFNYGLPKVVVTELEIHYDSIPGESLVRAATYGRGMWESPVYSGDEVPVADFDASITNISLGKSVQFTDLSTQFPYAWNWEFEGGTPSTSTLTNPVVSYNEAGVFKVILSVYNGTGRDTIVKEQLITVSCSQDLNYLAEKAISLPGNYQDLGELGMVIETPDFDNSNSDPVDIGFVFQYNCEEFTQFVLNTNGFIKLGDTNPSRPDLFFDEENGLFDSADPGDTYILSPFNYDLEASNDFTPEFRLVTSGEAPYRSCHIQFKGLQEKNTDGSRFNNIEFQIILYETSNVIEFMYGEWQGQADQQLFGSAAVGLKGSGNENKDILLVGKNSEMNWNSVYFQNEAYLPGEYGFNFADNVEGALPDPGRTFRFYPVYFRDLNVKQVYALNHAPIEFSSPEKIAALVHNSGYNDMLNAQIELKVTGANEYFNIVQIPRIESGQDYLVSFDPFVPLNLGLNMFQVSILQDDEQSDNEQFIVQETTDNIYRYATDEEPVSGVGISALEGGILSVKYDVNGSVMVREISVYLFNDPESIGQEIFAVVQDTSGMIRSESARITIEMSDLGKWHQFSLVDPVYINDQSFYAGLALTPSLTGNEYYVLGAQHETPIRPLTYFSSTLDGQDLTASDPDGVLRYMIGATVTPNLWEEGEASTNNDFLCYNTKGKVTLSSNPGKIQWQESLIPVGGWKNVEGGFGSTSKTYLSDYLYEDHYYRARITLGDTFVVYTNTVLIMVGPDHSYTETDTICPGNSYTFPDGKTIPLILESTEHLSEFKTVEACDSVITTYLNVLPGSYSFAEDKICMGEKYIFPDGNLVEGILKDTVYVSRFSVEDSCDSLVITSLEVILVNTLVTQTDTSLVANATNGEFQWLDCNNAMEPIEGATNREFIPGKTGTYAVFVQQNGCGYTSECIFFIPVNTVDIGTKNISVYPNPVRDLVFVESNDLKLISIDLLDISGKIQNNVEVRPESLFKQQLDMSHVSSGMYIIRIRTEEGILFSKILHE